MAAALYQNEFDEVNAVKLSPVELKKRTLMRRARARKIKDKNNLGRK